MCKYEMHEVHMKRKSPENTTRTLRGSAGLSAEKIAQVDGSLPVCPQQETATQADQQGPLQGVLGTLDAQKDSQKQDQQASKEAFLNGHT